MKAKLKSSEATKRLYWERKGDKLTNHDKRVKEWERKRKLFINCGSEPLKQDDFSRLMWR